jgi:hypothetical protein
MKIVSQFSDYYDHIEETYYSPGTPKVEYHRKTEHCSPSQTYRVREKLPSEKIESIRYFYDKKENWFINFFALGFCGRLYRGVQIKVLETIEVSYTLSGATYLPSKHGVQVPEDVEENAKKHFELWDDFCQDACYEIEDPSFVVLPGSFQNIQIIKNPVLSDFHFQKTMNSYDAFHRTNLFLVEQQERKSKKKGRSSNIWHFNPFISAFLTVQ